MFRDITAVYHEHNIKHKYTPQATVRELDISLNMHRELIIY